MELILLFMGLSACLLNNLAANQSIPTKEEQANLLLNVQEVFDQVKVLTRDEADSTNKSVVHDMELMVKRAEYILELLEQITLIRLSCDSNSVCMLESRPFIKQLAQDGSRTLKECTRRGGDKIRANSDRLANVTNSAVDRGQLLLDALENCSRKSGLMIISCYRNIIATDVLPVKRSLLGAIEAHRVAHFTAIDIREGANECVDEHVKKYRDLMEEALEKAMACT